MGGSDMRRFMPAVAIGFVFLLAFAGPVAAAGNAYTVDRLVSDRPGSTDFTDPNLVNAWGRTAGPSTPWWVADNGTDMSTLYGGEGDKVPLNIRVGGGPTGTIFNGTSDFVVSHNGKSGAALF